MEARFCKLDCIALAALACYGASVSPFIPQEISNVTGSVLCFMLTGVAAAAAILPRRASDAARYTAIISCSLGMGIIGGFILNFIPSGIVRSNWLTFALASTLIAYFVARVRGANSSLDWKLADFVNLNWVSGAKLFASALTLAAAIFISIGSANHGQKPFTEVWFVPNGPTHSPVGARDALFGMKSHESSDEKFTVVMDTGGQVTTNEVTLAPKQVWTQTVSLRGQKATATVYRGQPTNHPYRTVWIAGR